MARHIVKCKYCGKEFDRDKVPCKEVSSRRYAHLECSEANIKERSEEEQDLYNLEQYILKLFNEPYVSPRIKKQIKSYKEEYPDFTYSGIMKTLIYWYEIKSNPIEKANGGIGIVPFVYKEASSYYYSLYKAQQANENKNFNNISNVKIIEIESPQAILKKPKFFDIGENDNE